RWIATEELIERESSDERVELLARHSPGVERADEGADARADDQIRPNPEAVEDLEDADVRDAMCAAAGEDEGERRSRHRVDQARAVGAGASSHRRLLSG